MSWQPEGKTYVCLSVSVYPEDVSRVERLVERLKRGGYSKVSKSQVIRDALRAYEASLAQEAA